MREAWKIEHALWIDGVEAYERHMAPHCVMAFGPMGIIENAQIIEGLREAPRWAIVSMQDRVTIAPRNDLVVLAYRAEASRDAQRYEALCTSTYTLEENLLKLVQHQQTPLN